MTGPKSSANATMVTAKLLVTPAANILVLPPRDASRWLSSSGSTNAPSGTIASKNTPIDSISMPSTRQRMP